ncbi:putative Splicing factor-like protein [Giardia muris]|uniref:Putative Splicing factor-like protein n=1 Tax=Giardia muris TaxID=5742 RepID=A0A4Z1SZ41_GIAMU|nr:putative Splicing factor-like protein [Giardia muris]|eukprot:TNJ26923.1 putative Splicing factor-like protein [Giardia muris]
MVTVAKHPALCLIGTASPLSPTEFLLGWEAVGAYMRKHPGRALPVPPQDGAIASRRFKDLGPPRTPPPDFFASVGAGLRTRVCAGYTDILRPSLRDYFLEARHRLTELGPRIDRRLAPSIVDMLVTGNDPFATREGVVLRQPLTEETLLLHAAIYFAPSAEKSGWRRFVLPPPRCVASYCARPFPHVPCRPASMPTQLVFRDITLKAKKPTLHERNFQRLGSYGRAQRVPTTPHETVFEAISRSPMFSTERMEWLEACLLLLEQAHTAFQLVMHRKGITYLILDYNFELSATKTLSTKERKRSRFGKGFHLIRELARFLKYIVDVHVLYRSQLLAFSDFVASIYNLYATVGVSTGIYRYKYRLVRHIKQIKGYDTLIASGDLPCFSPPLQRIIIFSLRCLAPLAERYITHLLQRFDGRTSEQKRITQQRAEANQVLQLERKTFAGLQALSPGITSGSVIARRLQKHLTEAWRCWRAGIPYTAIYQQMSPELAVLVRDYVDERSRLYRAEVQTVAERLVRNKWIRKVTLRRYTARSGRLLLLEWKKATMECLESAPDQSLIRSSVRGLFLARVISTHVPLVPFPNEELSFRVECFMAALNTLRETLSGQISLSRPQQELQNLVTKALDNSDEFLIRAEELLLRRRTFPAVELGFERTRTFVYPIYTVTGIERIVDAYLAGYLAHSLLSDPRRYLLLRGFGSLDLNNAFGVELKIEAVNHYARHIRVVRRGRTITIIRYSVDLLAQLKSLNHIFLRAILQCFLDPVICDYIISRISGTYVFKDMTYVCGCGVPLAFDFSWLIAFILLALGDVFFLAGCMPCRDETQLPDEDDRLIGRYLDFLTAYLSRYSHDSPLVQLFSRKAGEDVCVDLEGLGLCYGSHKVLSYARVGTYVYLVCYGDVDKAPSLEADATNPLMSTYSTTDLYRLSAEGSLSLEMNAYTVTIDALGDYRLGVPEAVAMDFTYAAKDLLRGAGSTSFVKTVGKWNSLLLNVALYYRGALLSSRALLGTILVHEEKVQTRIKQELNTKTPTRFPQVVFNSPREYGGLGMLSIGSLSIPTLGLDGSISHDPLLFHSLLKRKELRWKPNRPDFVLPSILDVMIPWEEELVRCEHGYRNLLQQTRKRCSEHGHTGHMLISYLKDLLAARLGADDEPITLPRGVQLLKFLGTVCQGCNPWAFLLNPRIPANWTLSMRGWYDRHVIGMIYDLEPYYQRLLVVLGGINGILRHTLFPILGLPTPTSAIWQAGPSGSGIVRRGATRAQIHGQSQLPNRRFALWWSPTLNRSSVYVGFEAQIDLTGIFMCGRLATLKTLYVSLFRCHLWQSLHDSLSTDLLSAVSSVGTARREACHPRKSYRFHVTSNDVTVVLARPEVFVSGCTLLLRDIWTNGTELELINGGVPKGSPTRVWWLDLHLVWGNVDTRDLLSDKAKEKYLFYTAAETRNTYPEGRGMLVCIDLVYGTIAGYGDVPASIISGFRDVTLRFAEFVKANAVVRVMRERIQSYLEIKLDASSAMGITPLTLGSIFDPLSGGKAGAVLVLDDTLAYRFRTVVDKAGSHVRILNGFVVLLDPYTGQLRVAVVPATIYSGQSHRAALGRWSGAEAVANYLTTLPRGLRPRTLVVCRASAIDPVRTLVAGLDGSISVIGSSMDWGLGGIHLALISLRISDKEHARVPLDALIQSQEGSYIFSFDVYRALQAVSGDIGLPVQEPPATLFLRLLLYVKQLSISQAGWERMLAEQVGSSFSSSSPSLSTIIPKEFNPEAWMLILHMPRMTPDAWEALMESLRNSILQAYAVKSGINLDLLSRADRAQVLLGAELQAETGIQRRESPFQDVHHTTNAFGYDIAVTTQGVTLVSSSVCGNSTERYRLFDALVRARSSQEAVARCDDILHTLVSEITGTTLNKSAVRLLVGETKALSSSLPNPTCLLFVALLVGFQREIRPVSGPHQILEVAEVRLPELYEGTLPMAVGEIREGYRVIGVTLFCDSHDFDARLPTLRNLLRDILSAAYDRPFVCLINFGVSAFDIENCITYVVELDGQVRLAHASSTHTQVVGHCRISRAGELTYPVTGFDRMVPPSTAQALVSRFETALHTTGENLL